MQVEINPPVGRWPHNTHLVPGSGAQEESSSALRELVFPEEKHWAQWAPKGTETSLDFWWGSISRKASWRRRCLSLTLERGIEVSQAGTKSSFSLSSGVILFESHSVAMWYMGSGPSLCYRCGRSQGSEYRVTVLARVAFEAMTGTQIFGGSQHEEENQRKPNV